MKKTILLFSVLLISMLMIGSISAFMPPSHKNENKVAIDTYQGPSTDFYETCIEHPDLCYVGNVLTDVSVAYYYVNKGSFLR